MKLHNFLLLNTLLMCSTLHAEGYDYDLFLRSVAENNTQYLAEQYNIDIAVARQQAARVFNDPELSFDYGNNQDWDLQMGQSYELGLSYTLPLAPVRQSRKQVAADEQAMTESVVRDYYCRLRAEASEAYASAWLAGKEMKLAADNHELMLRLAQSDSIRLATGDINRADALQSSLEARQAESDYLRAEAAYHNALSLLSTYIGGKRIDSVMDITATHILPPAATIAELTERALEARADLKAAEIGKRLSANNLRLVKAERAPELTLNAGYVHSTRVLNEEAPAPMFDGFSVGVSLPLKFSSLNKGERRAAEYELQQAELQYRAAEEQIRADVEQAYRSYKAAEIVASRYDATLLNDAQLILESRLAAYTSGDSGLLELLAARQTYQTILTDYYTAIAEAFVASTNLLRAIGE